MTLPIPAHFDPDGASRVWRVPYAERATHARAWADTHGVGPACEDARRTCLLLVDCQNTFCLPDHELFVAGRSGRGAIDDNIRLARLIYGHLDSITEIVATFDTHTALQIFHPLFWVDPTGNHPVGGQTVITPEDIDGGVWRPNPAVTLPGRDPAWTARYARHYVRRLAEGRYALLVWPYHAMVGGIGHALVSTIEEAVFFHSVARATSPRVEFKGLNALTEHYSVLAPEVTDDHDGQPVAAANTALVDHLLAFDRIVIAGQAKSHCVAWTVHDLLDAITARDPGLAARVTLLDDCSSPVVIPGVADFTDQAERAYASFADAGMRRVPTTDF
jgi:nicotinamidase-related amidase